MRVRKLIAVAMARSEVKAGGSYAARSPAPVSAGARSLLPRVSRTFLGCRTELGKIGSLETTSTKPWSEAVEVSLINAGTRRRSRANTYARTGVQQAALLIHTEASQLCTCTGGWIERPGHLREHPCAS